MSTHESVVAIAFAVLMSALYHCSWGKTTAQKLHAKLARILCAALAGGLNVSLHALQVQDTLPSPFSPWTSNMAAEPNLHLTTRDLLRKSITLLSASSGSSRLRPLDTGISGQLPEQPATLFVDGEFFQPFTDTHAF